MKSGQLVTESSQELQNEIVALKMLLNHVRAELALYKSLELALREIFDPKNVL